MGEDIDENIRKKIEKLHDVSSKMEASSSEEEVFDIIIDAAENILEFYVCSIDMIDDEEFEVKRTIGGLHKKGDSYPVEGVAGETIKSGKSILINHVQESELAKPKRSEYSSVISVPIGEMGVFQAISDKVEAFDEYDLELAELMISHLRETLERIKNERAVRESEKRYKAIFNNTGTAKIILEDDLTINTVNQEFENLSGYNKKELEGHMKFKNFGYEDDIDKITDFMGMVKDNQDNISKKFELKFIDKSGNVKDTFGAISNISGSNEFNFSLLDITDFKWAIKELKKSEKKYKTVFEKTNTPMLIVREDTIVEMTNPKFVEVFGYSKEDIMNKKSWTEYVADDYLPMMKQYHEERRKDPDSVPSNYECEVYDRSGNVRRVLINVGMIPETQKSLISLVELSDGDGSTAFDKIFDRLEMGMCVLNTEGMIIEANRKFLDLFNYQRENILGKNYRESILSDSEKMIRDIIDGKIKFQMETIEYKTPEEETKKVKLNYSVIKKKDENYILCQAYPVSKIKGINE
ncbi:MAG: PAS domain S-box protein [Candidatus Saliniplasma sp.]